MSIFQSIGLRVLEVGVFCGYTGGGFGLGHTGYTRSSSHHSLMHRKESETRLVRSVSKWLGIARFLLGSLALPRNTGPPPSWTCSYDSVSAIWPNHRCTGYPTNANVSFLVSESLTIASYPFHLIRTHSISYSDDEPHQSPRNFSRGLSRYGMQTFRQSKI